MPPERPRRTICAIPEYLENVVYNADSLPPGHIFNLYAPMWVGEDFTSRESRHSERKWDIADNIDAKERWNDKTRRKEVVREERKSGKSTTLQRASQRFSTEVKRFQQSLIERQICLAELSDAHVIPCSINSPLATGLGNEHPIENGFSFLSPYGLPYIAGSGVKGALRHAAELMALFGEEYGINNFCMLDVWWLFGFEGVGASYWSCSKKPENLTDEDRRYITAMAKQAEKLMVRPDFEAFVKMAGFKAEKTEVVERLIDGLIHGKRKVVDEISFRGALTFWDAFPACDKMAVEIMTPHFSHYYQNGEAPHDSGQPNPIQFLAVPAGCEINLVINCQKSRYPTGNWREICEKIIKFASKWQGFGSKTAIGYGDFSINSEKMARLREESVKRQATLQENARVASLSGGMRKIEEFRKIVDSETKIQYKPGQSRLDQKLKDFYQICSTLSDSREILAAQGCLEGVFAYVKSNDKKKKEVRSELDKLKQKLIDS